MMCKTLVLMSLGMCVLAAGCQKKLTKEEAGLLEKSKQPNSFQISSQYPDRGQGQVKGSLGQTYKAVLNVLESTDIKVSSQGIDGISAQVNARLANDNWLSFEFLIIDQKTTKLFIRISGDKAPVLMTQIEYLFKQVIAQLEKN